MFGVHDLFKLMIIFALAAALAYVWTRMVSYGIRWADLPRHWKLVVFLK